MPGTLDYCEVVVSLCSLLEFVYDKFLDPSVAEHEQLTAAAIYIDSQIDSELLSPIFSFLERAARASLRAETAGVLSALLVKPDDT